MMMRVRIGGRVARAGKVAGRMRQLGVPRISRLGRRLGIRWRQRMVVVPVMAVLRAHLLAPVR
jgi:hypothetical protein